MGLIAYNKTLRIKAEGSNIFGVGFEVGNERVGGINKRKKGRKWKEERGGGKWWVLKKEKKRKWTAEKKWKKK